MHTPLTVEVEHDWEELRRRNLLTVLDPMVLRTADLFFAGAGHLAPAQRDRAWHAIDANVGALMTFVDSVLLWDEIPVFSCSSTFAESRLLEREPLAGVFWPVTVTGAEQEACEDSALAECARVEPAPSLVRGVLGELAGFGYEWHPSHPAGRFQAFMLGGLLFDAYAQRLSTDDVSTPIQAQRILPPKRAGLHAQVATGAEPAEALAEVARRVGAISFPRAPTFLPLLLREEDILTPAHLAERAMVWRTTHAVRGYRTWLRRLRTALADGDETGGLAAELAAMIGQGGSASGASGDDLAVEMGIDAVVLPPAGKGPVGFVTQGLSGGRCQKLMYRAPESKRLSSHIRRIWENG